MKKSFLFILMLSIVFSCSKEAVQESETLQIDLINQQNKAPTIPNPEIVGDFNSGCVANIIFLAEGFRYSEMSEFKALCEVAKQAIIDMEPFATVSNQLNFYRVDSASETSGVSSIKFDNECDSDPGVDTYSSTPWAVYTNRIGMQHYAGMKSTTREYLEEYYGGYATGDYAYTIVIANSTEYFGGAEFPGVSQHNEIENPRVSNMIVSKYDSGDIFKFLVRHEFGHSFGNMDDEYEDEVTNCAIHNFEPWFLPSTPKRNILLYNPGSWFEGGRYVPEGYWRQCENSIMRNDYFATTFCPRQGSIVKRRLAVAIDCP